MLSPGDDEILTDGRDTCTTESILRPLEVTLVTVINQHLLESRMLVEAKYQ
jgi:hypothetical protein